MKSGIFRAVALSAISCSYVAARFTIPLQEPLSHELPMLLESNVRPFDASHMNLTIFPIESMSSQEWQQHHETIKSLLGDKSYLLLRQAEIDAKQMEIFNYLDDNNVACGNYPPNIFADQQLERLWFTSGRVFDVGAKTVPNDVIAGLQQLEQMENDAFFAFMETCRASMYSGFTMNEIKAEEEQDIDDEKQSCTRARLPQTSWIEIPEEYRKYELTVAQVQREKEEVEAVLRKFYRDEERRILAVDTISELLRGNLGPEEAAETLTSFYDPFISTDKENGVVWQLWAIVASAVRNLGHVSEYTDRVIALLKSIFQLRKVHENGKAVIVESQTYWKDLPGFGLTLWLYCMDWKYDDPEEEAARLISGTTFAATFFSQGFGMEYMGSWALETLMNGLESSLDLPEDVQEVNRDIPAAATWIHLAGNDIFEYCRKNHERGPPTDNPYVWKGDQGYSLERWIFWKRRFYELSHAREMSAHAQALAAEALSKMETIESQGSASRVV